jgi:hypothetical protein
MHAQDTMQQVKDRVSSLRGQVDTRDVQERSEHALEQIERVPTSIYMLGILGTIALSAALFLTGRRAMALFVGLWPPTIIGLTQMTKQLHPSRDLDSMKKAA